LGAPQTVDVLRAVGGFSLCHISGEFYSFTLFCSTKLLLYVRSDEGSLWDEIPQANLAAAQRNP